MFTEPRFRTFEFTLLISALFHIAGLLLLSRTRPSLDTELGLQEVSFMDVTYRPEVAKVINQTLVTAGGSGTVDEGALPTYASGVAAEQVAPIDMSATLKRSESQAKIALDRYELARAGEMDVIRIGGRGSSQTTEQILTQAPIALPRGPAGSARQLGLAGVPGIPQTQTQPQLSIEHRPINKPSTATALPQLPTQTQPSQLPAVSKGTTFQIAGPISSRQIIKKVKPRYPKWALDQHISGKVVVRIWVLPNGQVKPLTQILSSSGYPDLDLVVIDALRTWEFAPLGPGVKPEEQWGDITFIFQLT